MTVPGGEVRLRRSASARLADGSVLQPLVSLVALVEVVIVAVTTYFVGLGVLVGALATLPLFLLWIVGLSAGARVDAAGISWRYFVRHAVSWSEITAVEFGRQGHSRFGGNGAPVVAVATATRRLVVSPALGVGDRRLKEFTDAIAALAGSAGVPVRVDPTDRYWKELLAGDLTA